MTVSVTDKTQVHIQDIEYVPNGVTEKHTTDNAEKRTSAFLYFAAVIANLNFVTLGTVIVWVSPVTSKLLSDNPDVNPLGAPITTIQLSFVGSLPQVGMVVGTLVFERVLNKFGRKICLNIFTLLLICGLVGLSFSKIIVFYYIFTFLNGMFLSGVLVGVPVYLSEITEDHNRAQLSCYMGLFMPIGNLFGFIMGPIFSVKVFTILTAFPSILSLIIFIFILPESPVYLITKNNRPAAELALNKFLEQDSLRVNKVADKIEFNLSQITKTKKANIAVIFTDRATRNGFIAACVLMILTATCGLPSIMSYLQPIFDATGTEVSGSIYAIIVGVVQVVLYFIASLLVEKWGRRPLLLFSSIASTIPLVVLGAYFHLQSIGSSFVHHITWLPVVGIIVLVVTAVIGLCSVALAYLNDVFTSNIKATAISLIYFVSGFFTAGSVFLFPIIQEQIGLAWSFWMFSIFSGLGFVFIYYRVPETKGKNILEIQEILSKY
ncbi:uncharacterized protein LOC114332135 [Diabrotica virgifera virgifera]|uniref:Major facilitator superfamily (MFS) profile domain-containing protein n=1 Tax=Diabrotica virgifera virgifera TaxID=50390 RepID=A0ABM5INX0_DIAVI|nr:uncharacterized protein LOC114332135 [Diabrotica virgifera virgifera]